MKLFQFTKGDDDQLFSLLNTIYDMLDAFNIYPETSLCFLHFPLLIFINDICKLSTFALGSRITSPKYLNGIQQINTQLGNMQWNPLIIFERLASNPNALQNNVEVYI